MNLIKATCIAAITLFSAVSSAAESGTPYVFFSVSGSGANQGWPYGDGNLGSGPDNPAHYRFYNEIRIVDGDKIVLTVWGSAKETGWGSGGESPTTFNFAARSFVIYRTFGGTRVNGFRVSRYAQFSDYFFGHGYRKSHYTGPEYEYINGRYVYYSGDIIKIGTMLGALSNDNPLAPLYVYGDHPGMDYGMRWTYQGWLEVSTTGVRLPSFPDRLHR